MLRRRVPTTVTITALIVVLLASAMPVSAHVDKEIASGKILVPAGETREIPLTVHYHRLVGHVRIDTPSHGLLKVRIAEMDGRNAAPLAEPGPEMRINALLPCCKGETWSEFVVQLRNDGAQDVQADVRLTAVHDGLAVAVEDAETGAAAAVVGMFAIVAALGIWIAQRPYSGNGSPKPWARVAFSAHLGMWFIALVFTIYGVFRYGGGLVGGMVAATTDLPRTSNGVLNTHSIIVLGLVLLWAVSVLTWAAAARRAKDERKRVAVFGLGLGFAAVAVFAIWIYEYGALLVPGLMLVAAVAVPFWGAYRLLKADRAEHPVATEPDLLPEAREPLGVEAGE